MSFFHCMYQDWDDHEDERADFKKQDRLSRRYYDDLIRHPDPRDPDHPDNWIIDDDE